MMEGTARKWTSGFEVALVEKNAQAACHLFLTDGWLRDSLVLSWDIRSSEGQAKILSYFQERLQDTFFVPGSFRLDATPGLEPSQFGLAAGLNGIEFGILFETSSILGRGYVRLQQEEATGAWRALTVYIAVQDIKGYEEKSYEMGLYQGMPLNWSEVVAERRHAVENDPEVLVGEFDDHSEYRIPFNLYLKLDLVKRACRLRPDSSK